MKEGGFLRRMYYKDYARKIVADEKMENPHVEYVYEGIYYTLDGTEKEWRQKKLQYLVCQVLSVFFLIWDMTMELSSNYLKAVTFFQVAALFLMLGNGACIVSRVTAKRRMTVGEYKLSVISIKEFSVLTGGFLLLLLLVIMRNFWDGSCMASGEELLGLGKLAVSMILSFWLADSVRREHYLTEVSRDLPHGIDLTDDFNTYS